MCVLCLCVCVDWVDACVCVTIWQYGFLRGKEEVGEGIHCYSLISHPPQQNLETFWISWKSWKESWSLPNFITHSCYDLERWQQLQKYWSGHCLSPIFSISPVSLLKHPSPMSPKFQLLRDPAGSPRAPLWLPSSCAWQMLNVFTISLLSPNDLTPCEKRENIENI